MTIEAEWVSAIANAAVALGLLFTFFQLRHAGAELELTRRLLQLGKQQLEDDHARSRREKAVDLIGQWARNANQRAASARKLAERLTFDEASTLFKQEQLSLDAKLKDLIDSALEKSSDPPVNGKIVLTLEQTAEIRWQVVMYLNKLEAIISAWSHEVADRGMLEEQFHFLISPKEDVYIMKEFRQAAGGDEVFPAIGKFVEHMVLERQRKIKVAGSKKLGASP